MAADIFVSDNLLFPRIREVAFDKAISCQKYKEAEQLCVDALSDETDETLSSKNSHH
ncbi:MAG: hypothetical protein LBU32_02085 [Clostridiales bacterium]|jgi:hypothetical protein|nr:hypothetical protein [Clostridiales bacterium]